VDKVRAFRMLSLVMSAALVLVAALLVMKARNVCVPAVETSVVRVVPTLEKEESHESDTQASRGRGGLPGL